MNAVSSGRGRKSQSVSGTKTPVQDSTDRDRPGRRITTIACQGCQKRKCKCGGERPTCSACRARNFECVYDVADGTSRSADLKTKNQALAARVAQYDLLFSGLCRSSDLNASNISARMRIGEDLESIIASLHVDGHVQHAPPASKRRRGLSPTSEDGTSLHKETAQNGTYSDHGSRRASTTSSEHNQSETRPAVWHSEEQQFENMPLGPGRPVSQHSEFCASRGGDSSYGNQHAQYAIPAVASESSSPVELINWAMEHAMQLNTPTYTPSMPAEYPTPIPDVSSLAGDATLPDLQQTPSPYHMAYISQRASRASKMPDGSQHGAEQTYRAPKVVVSRNVGKLYPPIDNPFLTIGYHPPSHSHPTADTDMPAWALTCNHEDNGRSTSNEACRVFLTENRAAIQAGKDAETICGKHPDIRLCFGEDTSAESSELSKWAARSYCSRTGATTVTQAVMMWASWYSMRWQIDPTPSNYEAIPRWLRPTPTQICVPHAEYIDFQIWPALRDASITMPWSWKYPDWSQEMMRTISTEWPLTLEESIYMEGSTSEVHSNPLSIEYVQRLENWSVGPGIRQYIPNADAYVPVRYEKDQWGKG